MLIITALAVTLTFQFSMAQQVRPASQKSSNAEQFVSIDFNNVDINVFIKFMSELTATNFVVDQRVKGKVTIISPSKKGTSGFLSRATSSNSGLRSSPSTAKCSFKYWR